MIGVFIRVIHFILDHKSGLIKDVLLDAMQLVDDNGGYEQCQCAIGVVMISIDATKGEQCTDSNICKE